MKKPIIISLFNNKGGVGKSTIAVNLASLLSNDFKVLLIDNDPQGNATSALSEELNQANSVHNAYKDGEVEFKKVEFLKAITTLREHEKKTGRKSFGLTNIQEKIQNKNLYILPGSHKLNVMQEMLIDRQDREKTLFQNLKNKLGDFDFVLIDNPPAINVLTWNSLYIADYVLIPFKPGRAELDGTEQLLETLKTLDEKLKKKVEILGVIINMYTDTNVSEFFLTEVIKIFKNMVFDTIIPATVKYMDATSVGLPIDIFVSKTEDKPAVDLYKSFVKEILHKLK